MTWAEKLIIGVIVAVALSVSIVMLASGANAGHRGECTSYEQAKDRLAAKYDEYPIGRGTNNDGDQAIIFFASESGTWSVIVVFADKCSAMVASGTAWVIIPWAENTDDRGA